MCVFLDSISFREPFCLAYCFILIEYGLARKNKRKGRSFPSNSIVYRRVNILSRERIFICQSTEGHAESSERIQTSAFCYFLLLCRVCLVFSEFYMTLIRRKRKRKKKKRALRTNVDSNVLVRKIC